MANVRLVLALYMSVLVAVASAGPLQGCYS